ncbi:MAG: FliO/MopB family protein [Nitrospirae bacterium]|nr:FliO/MopB family protein [Nitrospirota bacterium]
MTGAYVQMAAALVFVVLLIVATAFIFKKKQAGTGFMSIVGYQPFGPKKGVAALRVGKEVLILGVTPNEMRLLKTFGEGELELPEGEAFHNKFERFRARIKAEGK